MLYAWLRAVVWYATWTTVICGCILAFARWLLHRHRPTHKSIGFFHPFCNDGGGGERVLWRAVQVMREKYPTYACVVYSGDVTAAPEEILAKVKDRFDIDLSTEDVSFCFLKTRFFLEARLYPVGTILGQNLGAMIVGLEAVLLHNPHVFVDTMGYAFTMPIFRFLAGSWVACYVHYPTVSIEMVTAVNEGKVGHNNSGLMALPPFRTVKRLYYRIFAALYSMSARAADVIMTNSSWTRRNLEQLWSHAHLRTSLVYPPCNVTHLTALPLEGRDRNLFLSIAQFRPEKDQALQLRAVANVIERYSDKLDLSGLRLTLIGSCRHTEDEALVASLKQLAEKLNITKHVEFAVNVPYAEMQTMLSMAQFGLHSMWMEHFGIGIVEQQAAGLVVVAHNSGGPKEDILLEYDGEPVGLLASNAEEYADRMAQLLQMDSDAIRKTNARASASRFTDDVFSEQFALAIHPLVQH